MKLVLACILKNSQTLEIIQNPYLLRKHDRNFRDMFENRKLCIVMKIVRGFVKKNLYFRKETNNNICRCRHA